MAIDFPNSPTTNQDYTVDTTTWTYDGAKWILKTYNSLHAVPITAMMLWANTTYPTGWLLADGSAISRVTYSDLFTAISTTYGVGDGSTTFNLPSMPSAGTGSPNTIIKVTNSGALEPSAISHASNHISGGSDVIVGDSISSAGSYTSWTSTSATIGGQLSGINSALAMTQNAQTASYTLVLTDRNKLVEISNASANNLTVPLNSSVAFPVGSQITILQTGAGQTTIVATGGVTINATPGLKLRTQWSSATLVKRAADTWVAIGDLTA